jgi:hypothetical protein
MRNLKCVGLAATFSLALLRPLATQQSSGLYTQAIADSRRQILDTMAALRIPGAGGRAATRHVIAMPSPWLPCR